MRAHAVRTTVGNEERKEPGQLKSMRRPADRSDTERVPAPQISRQRGDMPPNLPGSVYAGVLTGGFSGPRDPGLRGGEQPEPRNAAERRRSGPGVGSTPGERLVTSRLFLTAVLIITAELAEHAEPGRVGGRVPAASGDHVLILSACSAYSALKKVLAPRPSASFGASALNVAGELPGEALGGCPATKGPASSPLCTGRLPWARGAGAGRVEAPGR